MCISSNVYTECCEKWKCWNHCIKLLNTCVANCKPTYKSMPRNSFHIHPSCVYAPSCVPEKVGISQKWYSCQKCGVNIIEHSQSKGVKLKTREQKIKKWCKLARGIRGGEEKNQAWNKGWLCLGNKKIFCIFKTYCIFCFSFHKMPFISKIFFLSFCAQVICCVIYGFCCYVRDVCSLLGCYAA